MAGSVNKVILVGNLGRDPEIRSFPSGGKVANFSMATSETWRDRQSGERRERTQWHNISVYNENLVSLVERFLRKGSKIYVEGQLETRKWQDQQGQDRYTTEVALRPYRGELTFLDRRSDGDGGGAHGGGEGGYGGAPAGPDRDTGGGAPPDAGGFSGPGDEIDDDIPF